MTRAGRPQHARDAATRPGTLAALLAAALILLAPAPGRADEAQDAWRLVDQARLAAEAFAADPQLDPSWRELIRNAKGLLVLPEVVKAGFILGGSGGSGALLVRNERAGRWTGPAFYTVGGVSFGLLAGAQVSEVLMVVRTERGLTQLLASGAKLGADLSVAVGPVGAGVAAGNITADLVVLARSKGAYGGLSVDGSVVAVREAWNRAYYYGKPLSPIDILIHGEGTNPQADGLLAAVARLTAPR